MIGTISRVELLEFIWNPFTKWCRIRYINLVMSMYQYVQPLPQGLDEASTWDQSSE